MRGAERVVFALGALGEAGQAVALAQGADAVAAAGQDLVRIGLMADVPDQPVVRRVEDVMQRDRQFDDAEAGAEMAAGDRDRIDRLGAQLVGDLPELALVEPPQVVGSVDLVKEGRLRRLGHQNLHDKLIETTELPGAAGAQAGPPSGPYTRLEPLGISTDPLRIHRYRNGSMPPKGGLPNSWVDDLTAWQSSLRRPAADRPSGANWLRPVECG